MLNKFIFCLFFIFAYSALSSCQNETDNTTKPEVITPVLVISIDSFRWDFIQKIRQLRNYQRPKIVSRLWELIENGTHAPDGIGNNFTSTMPYPNQYSMVTGLYPINHGVVSDIVYEPNLKRTANLHDAEDAWAFGGEPIWKTLSKDKSKSMGCYMWIGCENGGNGIDKAVKFRENKIWHERIDQAVQWLEEGMELVLVTVPEIDNVGRLHGPDLEQMNDALINFDEDIAYLMKKLKDIGPVNLILLSGNGITKRLQETPILSETKDTVPGLYQVNSKTSTTWFAQAFGGRVADTIANFNKYENVLAWSKDNVMDEWRGNYSHRISDVIVEAKLGYALSGDFKGLYGYYNSQSRPSPDLRGFFVGYGPAFIANSTVPSQMMTVDVYQLICLLLDEKPAPNNGTTKYFQYFLQPNYLSRLSTWPNVSDEKPISYVAIIILSIILLLGIFIGSWLCYRSGECTGRGRQAKTTHTKSVTIDTMATEQGPIMRKYDSEMIILELDDAKQY